MTDKDILGTEGDKRAREVISTLAELRQRLIYEGDLSAESRELYDHIEQTLHEAIGELYGWSTKEETAQAQNNQGSTGSQGRDS